MFSKLNLKAANGAYKYSTSNFGNELFVIFNFPQAPP